jgi:hypothetical protein
MPVTIQFSLLTAVPDNRNSQLKQAQSKEYKANRKSIENT